MSCILDVFHQTWTILNEPLGYVLLSITWSILLFTPWLVLPYISSFYVLLFVKDADMPIMTFLWWRISTFFYCIHDWLKSSTRKLTNKTMIFFVIDSCWWIHMLVYYQYLKCLKSYQFKKVNMHFTKITSLLPLFQWLCSFEVFTETGYFGILVLDIKFS